jgi:hypothetical protein
VSHRGGAVIPGPPSSHEVPRPSKYLKEPASNIRNIINITYRNPQFLIETTIPRVGVTTEGTIHIPHSLYHISLKCQHVPTLTRLIESLRSQRATLTPNCAKHNQRNYISHLNIISTLYNKVILQIFCQCRRKPHTMRVTYKSVQLSTPIDVQISIKKHKKHGKHGKISPPKVHNFIPTNSKDTEVDEVPDKEFKRMRQVQ